MLVGGEGIRSRVRRQFLPDAKEVNAPGIGIGGKLASPTTQNPGFPNS